MKKTLQSGFGCFLGTLVFKNSLFDYFSRFLYDKTTLVWFFSSTPG